MTTIRTTFLLTAATILLSAPVCAYADGLSNRLVVKLLPQTQSSGATQYADKIDSLLVGEIIFAETALFPDNIVNKSLASSGTPFPHDRYRIVHLEEMADGDDVLEALNEMPDVEYAEYDYPIELFGKPNDPLLNHEWGLENTGQQYLGILRRDGYYNDSLVTKQGTPDADMRVSHSWTTSTQRVKPLVVIIDTGLDTGHPDIVDNLWVNPGEISGNGIDDDHNGYIDDIHGWDFSGDEAAIGSIIFGDNDVSDQVGHGTHCAGTVGATTGNGIGIAGVCDEVRIVGLKIFPNAVMSVASKAIVYAVGIGAEVINMSWGSPYRSTVLLEALTYARSHGVLPVAASGNFASDMSTFPAAFPQSMTVGASNSDDEVTFFSSYGEWVDVAAPGRDIMSLRASGTDMYADNGEPEIRIIDDLYYLADGTSMAAPHAAGAAAIILSYSPGLSPDRVQEILEQSADDIVLPYGDPDSTFVGWDRYSGHGRINVEAAIAMLNGSLAKIDIPYSRQIVTSDIQIVGHAYSESSEDYSLDISLSNDLMDWDNLAAGSAGVSGGLLGTLSVAGLAGDYTLRLTVGDDLASYRRIIVASERTFEIDSPADGDTVSWFLNVRGTLLDPNFESYSVFLKSDDPDADWDTVFRSTKAVADSIIASASLGPYRSGDYTLRVTGYSTGEEFSADRAITIEDKLIGAFPQTAPLNGVMHYAPTVCNIDGQGNPELIVSSRSGMSVMNFDGTPYCCGWPQLYGVDCYSAATAYDMNQDGVAEIAVTAEQEVYLFDYVGARVESFPKNKPVGYMSFGYSTPLMADLDSDGNCELLWLAFDGNVYAYRSDGTSYFASLDGEFARTSAGFYFGSLVPFLISVDLEDDGQVEVIAGYESSTHGGALYAWQGANGQPLPGKSTAMIRQFGKLRGGCVADFDQNGTYDIAVVGRTETDTVFAAIIDADGNYLPGWPRTFSDRWQYIVTYPAAGDIDDDGYPELIYAISSLDNGEIYVLNHDGTSYRPNLSGDGSYFAAVNGALGSVVFGDVSGDGTPDIVVRAGSVFPGLTFERVFAFDREGDIIDGWPIYTYAAPPQVTSTTHTPVITDMDGDGFTDLVCTSDDRQAYVWKLETPYDENAVPWGQFMHDSRNSGVLPGRGTPTAADDDPDNLLPESFSLSQNYPNPFNPTTTIEFQIDRSSHVVLEVFNLLGQRIRTLLDRPMVHGKHSVVWDGRDSSGEDVASGVYFYRVLAGTNTETRKMVKLK